jgi:hypothetical protein
MHKPNGCRIKDPTQLHTDGKSVQTVKRHGVKAQFGQKQLHSDVFYFLLGGLLVVIFIFFA